MFVWRRRVVDFLEQPSDGFPGRARADKWHPILAIEATDGVAEEIEAFLG
jgi:hypothetical protein